MDRTTPRIAKNRSGKWELRWAEIDRDAGETKWHSKTQSCGTRRYDEAERFRADFVRSLAVYDRDVRDGHVGATIAGIVGSYLEALAQRRTHAAQEDALRRLLPFLGAYAPEDINRRLLAEYRRHRGAVTDPTVRRELGALKAALNWAMVEEIIRAAPRIELPPGSAPREAWLNETEEAQLWQLALAWRPEADGRLSRVARFVAIGLGTGARKGAIEGLTWNRVDLQHRTINFVDPKVPPSKKRRVAAAPINDRLLPVLRQAWAERTADPCVIGKGEMGRPFRAFAATTPWGRTLTPHVMRHTFCTLMLRAGVSLYDLGELVADTEKTLRENYAHAIVDKRFHEVANRRFVS